MSGTYMTQNRTQWRVFCPRFGLTWPRIGHSDVYSVRDLFQSDTVTCFPPEILDLHASESDTETCLSEIYFNRTQWRVFCPRFGRTWPRIGHSDVYSARDLFQSDTVTCFPSEILDLHSSESDTVTLCLSEIYFNRTQWCVFCPRFWTYTTQNRTQWRCVCPRFIPIGHSDMFSVEDIGLTWPRIGNSDVYSVRDLFQSDTVTCFLYEILDLHDLESDTVTCYMSENLEIRILSPLSTAS